jgi:BOP1NT (NUC169) domain
MPGRCLDLYLCPRVRQRRVHIDDPKSLLPALPKPRDLQPFPTRLAKRFTGHTAHVRSTAVDVWHPFIACLVDYSLLQALRLEILTSTQLILALQHSAQVTARLLLAGDQRGGRCQRAVAGVGVP